MTKTFVAGHNGLVGSAICRRLQADGVDPIVASRSDMDLLDQAAVKSWFAKQEVEHPRSKGRAGSSPASGTTPISCPCRPHSR